MAVTAEFTNTQGDYFDAAVFQVQTATYNIREIVSIINGTTDILTTENITGSKNINCTFVYWSSQANKDADADYYSMISGYSFNLEGDYLDAYDNTSGTEGDKLKAACELYLQTEIL